MLPGMLMGTGFLSAFYFLAMIQALRNEVKKL